VEKRPVYYNQYHAKKQLQNSHLSAIYVLRLPDKLLHVLSRFQRLLVDIGHSVRFLVNCGSRPLGVVQLSVSPVFVGNLANTNVYPERGKTTQYDRETL
jgi:hypothetical protein